MKSGCATMPGSVQTVAFGEESATCLTAKKLKAQHWSHHEKILGKSSYAAAMLRLLLMLS
jgi:hypothetical protein